jgi:hypothetical protein
MKFHESELLLKDFTYKKHSVGAYLVNSARKIRDSPINAKTRISEQGMCANAISADKNPCTNRKKNK